jgi:hypothetical protein
VPVLNQGAHDDQKAGTAANLFEQRVTATVGTGREVMS